MKPRGQSPARRSSHVEITAAMTDARARTSTARPITAWQGSQGKGFSSLPGAFAVHGQSVKQTQVRAAAADNGFRNRKLPQPSTSPDKIKHSLSDALAFDQFASLDSSKKYLGAVRAVPRSNSMPTQQSLARAQSAIHGGRAVSRSASRGRQDTPSAEPQPAKPSFNGLIFKQSRQGDVLIVSRTLAARMAAPHTLHLDHLKLSQCCLVEGEEQSLQALPRTPSLRGLMLGRNYISTVDTQQALKSLEVLDLHNNLVETLTGLTALTNLRRLNLAGNRISSICSLSMLTSLEDLDLNRNFLVSLAVSKPVAGNVESDRTGGMEETYWPASLRKLTLAANRLATLDDLVPLQQLSGLTQLGLEGNPCCNLHPISRFRIEVLARHCTSLQLMDSHKVTAEERSLAAAMRWQDELTSRGCLPTPDPSPSSATSLASLESRHLGDGLAGLSSSHLLSVRPVSMQGQRPATVLGNAASQSTSEVQDRDTRLAQNQTDSMHPVVLERKRLLSSKQASALLSGIPPHIRAAKMKQQESLLQPAEFEPEAWQGVNDLLCIGQGQQPSQGVPSMCPPAEDGSQSPASPRLQQPGASAELVDGYQLHITGDAMDALQSPVCASAREVILKGVPWDRVVWGMPMVVVLQRLRKLVLTDNHLCHLHQVEGLSALVKLEELTIRHNPILRQVLLRPYVCFCLPTIQVFNGQPILGEEYSRAEEMFQALHETRLAASSQPLNQLAKALHARPDHPAEAKHASNSDQEVPPQQETVQHAAEAVWSDLVQRVIQQEARSKKFDEIWPRILDGLIQKGFSGVY
ncbi:hypothetical protein WJX82_002456 [Trebouxia sp. C0006]